MYQRGPRWHPALPASASTGLHPSRLRARLKENPTRCLVCYKIVLDIEPHYDIKHVPSVHHLGGWRYHETVSRAEDRTCICPRCPEKHRLSDTFQERAESCTDEHFENTPYLMRWSFPVEPFCTPPVLPLKNRVRIDRGRSFLVDPHFLNPPDRRMRHKKKAGTQLPPPRRIRCTRCEVVTTEFTAHWSKYHVGVVREEIPNRGVVVELSRMPSGFFHCPFCLNHQIRDSRLVKEHLLTCIANRVPSDTPALAPTDLPKEAAERVQEPAPERPGPAQVSTSWAEPPYTQRERSSPEVEAVGGSDDEIEDYL
ncbi:hypothetical protein BDM02DRAFT_3193166 [Thelephora ganbajun]|uniref:Uncharacterized protein n=1 Tax=Thelephora ganbajun TaxID=370292 RepID=A0ACB6YYD0_THEGA|nr:hypothetical protein BDM02DRAFT_3193166 [Thelephora ganbajun]